MLDTRSSETGRWVGTLQQVSSGTRSDMNYAPPPGILRKFCIRCATRRTAENRKHGFPFYVPFVNDPRGKM